MKDKTIEEGRDKRTEAIRRWMEHGPSLACEIPCASLAAARTLASELKSQHGCTSTIKEPDYDRWWCGAPHKVVTDEDGSQRLVRVFHRVIVHRVKG